ncbi:hypothetical protein U9M48_018797 [Paspalum notatum var. saurae]|uniref:Gag-pol polyprotein n=1 Tax=Paspalum notatum var. saurae TaxID=547442 RepID=A0AAQ3WQV7_PASNO
MNKNLVSGSLLLRDGFKVVLESNKVVVSRHGLFIDFSNNCVNHICGGINDDAIKSDVPDMYVDTIMESHDATFFENIFSMKDMHSTSRFSSEITPELNTPTKVSKPPHEITLEEDDNEAPRKSQRQRIEKSFGNDFIVYLVDGNPTSISEAYASPDADNWKDAIQSELDYRKTYPVATVEADRLSELLMDLPVVEKPIPAILMNCDNQTAIAKVNSDKDNAKSSRYVRRRVKSIRNMRHSVVISVTYIQTEKNLQIPLQKDYHIT